MGIGFHTFDSPVSHTIEGCFPGRTVSRTFGILYVRLFGCTHLRATRPNPLFGYITNKAVMRLPTKVFANPSFGDEPCLRQLSRCLHDRLAIKLGLEGDLLDSRVAVNRTLANHPFGNALQYSLFG